MTRPVPTDRQPKARAVKARDVRMAVITTTETGASVCSCGGFTYWHTRAKVRETAIQRHLDRKHGSQGLWL